MSLAENFPDIIGVQRPFTYTRDWERYREKIQTWYKNYSASEIISLLRREGFDASYDQLTYRIKKWGLRKRKANSSPLQSRTGPEAIAGGVLNDSVKSSTTSNAPGYYRSEEVRRSSRGRSVVRRAEMPSLPNSWPICQRRSASPPHRGRTNVSPDGGQAFKDLGSLSEADEGDESSQLTKRNKGHDAVFDCPSCESTLTTQQDLIRHYTQHYACNELCQFCSNTFTTAWKYITHGCTASGPPILQMYTKMRSKALRIAAKDELASKKAAEIRDERSCRKRRKTGHFGGPLGAIDQSTSHHQRQRGGVADGPIGIQDAEIQHNNATYVRGSAGPFKGMFVNGGSLINIGNKNYVQFRVLYEIV